MKLIKSHGTNGKPCQIYPGDGDFLKLAPHQMILFISTNDTFTFKPMSDESTVRNQLTRQPAQRQNHCPLNWILTLLDLCVSSLLSGKNSWTGLGT